MRLAAIFKKEILTRHNDCEHWSRSILAASGANISESERPLEGGAWKLTREDAPASNHKSVPGEAFQGTGCRGIEGLRVV